MKKNAQLKELMDENKIEKQPGENKKGDEEVKSTEKSIEPAN